MSYVTQIIKTSFVKQKLENKGGIFSVLYFSPSLILSYYWSYQDEYYNRNRCEKDLKLVLIIHTNKRKGKFSLLKFEYLFNGKSSFVIIHFVEWNELVKQLNKFLSVFQNEMRENTTLVTEFCCSHYVSSLCVVGG